MQKELDREKLFAAVSAEAANIDRYMRADVKEHAQNIDGLLSEVLEYGLFNGGKRIRPLLVLLASRLCGGADDGAYMLGCAFEYLHAATLFHDDIIDKSEIRRGKPSVYKKYGVTPAILAGDYLLALSMERIGQFAGQEGLKIFCKAATGMVDGEFMQLRNAEKYNLTALDYHNVIMGKTALLISAACEIGAVYGGGSQLEQSKLKDYGMHIGCAFQIIDDLLDYLGDPMKTGKKVGADLLEGKMTLPLIIAINDGKEKDRTRLKEIIENESLRTHCVAEVIDIISGNSGFAGAREVAFRAAEDAVDLLQVFNSTGVNKEKVLLQQLASYIVEREK